MAMMKQVTGRSGKTTGHEKGNLESDPMNHTVYGVAQHQLRPLQRADGPAPRNGRAARRGSVLRQQGSMQHQAV